MEKRTRGPARISGIDSETLVDLLTFDPNDEKGFYEQIIHVFNEIIPLSLGTVWFRHTESRSGEDYAVFRSIKDYIGGVIEEVVVQTHYPCVIRMDNEENSFLKNCFMKAQLEFVADFTQDVSFQWMRLYEWLSATSIIACPLLSSGGDSFFGVIHNPFATVLLHPKNQIINFDHDLRIRLENTAELVSIALDRFMMTTRGNRRKSFALNRPVWRERQQRISG